MSSTKTCLEAFFIFPLVFWHLHIVPFALREFWGWFSLLLVELELLRVVGVELNKLLEVVPRGIQHEGPSNFLPVAFLACSGATR